MGKDRDKPKKEVKKPKKNKPKKGPKPSDEQQKKTVA
jgi:hypothetical protein